MNEQELLQNVKTAVLEIEPTAEVILFGSRARGDARPDSDKKNGMGASIGCTMRVFMPLSLCFTKTNGIQILVNEP